MLFYMKKEIQERLAGLSIAFESTKGIVHFRQMCMPELLLIQLPFVQEFNGIARTPRVTLHPGQCSVRIFVPLEFLCQLPFGATFLTAFIHGTVEPIFSTPGLVRFDRLETQRYDMGHQVRVRPG